MEEDIKLLESKNRIFQINIKKPNYLFEIISLIATFISVLLYIKSLEGCSDTQAACLVNLSPEFINLLLISIFGSALIFTIIIFMSIIRNFRLYISIINTICFFCLFKYDQGGDLAHHGSYNSGLFLLSFFIFLPIISFFYYTITVLLIKRKSYYIVSSAFIIVLLFTIILNSKLKNACDKWDEGLNNEKIINEGIYSSCVITKPKYCWQYIFDGLLDVSWILSENCEKFRAGEKQELFKYLNLTQADIDKIDSIGYPNTSNWPFKYNSYFENLQKNVLNEMVFYDKNGIELKFNNKNQVNNTTQFKRLKPEVYLKFDNNNYGTINITIERNNTLIKEKEEKYTATKHLFEINKKRSNVLIIYIDSISRAHYYRKMKKTIEFINNYYNKNKQFDNTKSHNSFQFMKYHQFHTITQYGTVPMFYGQSLKDNNGTHILNNLNELGYITGFSNNQCTKEMFDLEKGAIENNLNFGKYDHELESLFCDPNFTNLENPYTPYLGPYSVKKRCLYGKNTYEYVFEFGVKFWESYSDQAKYLLLAFQDAHEGTGEVTRYLDDYLNDFLLKMNNLNYLENTNIIFLSDHGNKMIGFYQLFNCDDFIKEGTLGTLFLVIPKESDYLNQETFDNLLMNQNAMITPYDIYMTINNIIGYSDLINYYNKIENNKESVEMLKKDYDIKNNNKMINYRYNSLSISLFSPIPARDCFTYAYDLDKQYCRCSNNLE